ncbi:DUF3237 domain-containing protein [Filobacillus milosensis]|uniref:UPF0311 protein E3U55_06950 n=1 Tax=Filobacillus milosensis TaxID=94137 RepID=A0A4Y8IL62_9BACI|nr:DUF3237 domain-containing protein [Filobacillus milosensis]TFB22031.1 DUF3237 domain-containing protein [Filobacillus milosensis]
MEHFEAPGLSFLFNIELTIDQPYHLGVTPIGNRQIIRVNDGYFRGEKLNGTVVPGGDDCTTLLDDGTIMQDVKILLKTYDGEYILMTYQGIRTGSKDVLKRLDNHLVVDVNEYYFVTQPKFETSSKKYDWLNKRIFVSRGKRTPDKYNYSIYTVGD